MFSEGERLILQRVCSAVPGISEDALGILWNAIKTEMASRLAAERKPLDLGFVKIIPVPWRQNWKELLLEKAEAFHDGIDDPKLMAIHPKKEFILWSIEVIPSDALVRKLDEGECDRRHKLGLEDYSDAIIHKDTKAALPYASRLINIHHDRSTYSSPVRRFRGAFRILAHRLKVDGYCDPNPSQGPACGPGPSTACPTDKKTQPQESSTHSPPSETVPDPLPEERRGDTGAALG